MIFRRSRQGISTSDGRCSQLSPKTGWMSTNAQEGRRSIDIECWPSLLDPTLILQAVMRARTQDATTSMSRPSSRHRNRCRYLHHPACLNMANAHASDGPAVTRTMLLHVFHSSWPRH